MNKSPVEIVGKFKFVNTDEEDIAKSITKVITVRLSKFDVHQIKVAAALVDTSMNKFCRAVLNRATDNPIWAGEAVALFKRKEEYDEYKKVENAATAKISRREKAKTN